MDQFVFKICQSTQSPEKFLCLNEECFKQEKKQLQCYQCMTKSHLGKNKVVKHVDDFIELDKLMGEVKKKQDKRTQLVMNLTQQIIDFKKQKLQEVQQSRNLELIAVSSQKIEEEVNSFLKYIHECYLNFKFSTSYQPSNHLAYIKFHLEDDSKSNEESKNKLKVFTNNIDKYLSTLDLDLRTTVKRSKEKYENLEKQVNQFNKQIVYNKLQTYLLFILIPYLLYLQFNQFEIQRWQQKSESQIYLYEQMSQQLQLFQSQINLNQMQMEIMSMNQNQTYQILNSSISQLSDGLQKLKLRFDTFKQSSTLNLEKYSKNLSENITQLETAANQLNQATQQIESEISQLFQRFQQLEKSTQQLIVNQNQQFTLFAQSFEKIRKETNLIKIKKILLTTKAKSVKLKFTQLKSYLKLLIHYRHFIKIHVNAPKSQFNQFELIYDKLFTSFFSVQVMMEIESKAFKNDGDNPLICVGGLSIANPTIMNVIACDFATEVFQATFAQRKARKSKYGDIYWYQVEFSSFGFAPSENILLLYCDDYDEQDQRRLSYWYNLAIPSGGRRLGNEILLENSTNHRLQIYMLKMDQE